jgi:hypothetical protein
VTHLVLDAGPEAQTVDHDHFRAVAETLEIAQTGLTHRIHEFDPAQHLPDGQILSGAGRDVRLEEQPKVDDHAGEIAEALYEPAFDYDEKFATISQCGDPDAREAIHEGRRKFLLAEVPAGVHRADNLEILVPNHDFHRSAALLGQGDRL